LENRESQPLNGNGAPLGHTSALWRIYGA